MAKSILYDCYAYIYIGYPHNSYPIQHPEQHLESILQLKEGDRIHIKGLGEMIMQKMFIDEHRYIKDGQDGLYQEISLKCTIIQ